MKLIYQNKVYKISQVKQGPQGAKGLSNYQIYLANTNDDPVLSEAEWIAATDAARIAAENSAAAAANSAAAAATSEGNAANSSTAAAASEANTTASATAAAASETNAANSAAAASASEANAASSETNAANSAAAAAASEANAATSETNASNSATAAAGSETNATNSAAAAATSEGNAATSETNAAASAAAAATSAASVAEEVNTVAGDFYTLVAGDNRDIVHCTNVNGCNVRIPSGLDSGYRVRVMMTSGNGLISAASGVSFNGVTGSVIHVAKNYTGYLITHLGGDVFSVIEEPEYLFTPAMLMDAKRGVLVEGGGAAGYADKVATVTDETSNGNNPAQGTETFRPTNIPYLGRNYGHFSGLTGNTLRIDTAWENTANRGLDLKVKLYQKDWLNRPLSEVVAGAWFTAQRCWNFYLSAGNAFVLELSTDGVNTTYYETAAIPAALVNDAYNWIRVVYIPDNGSGNSEVRFMYSTDATDDPDEVNWTQSGITDLNPVADLYTIPAGTGVFNVMSNSSGGSPASGQLRRVYISDIFDGPAVLDWDADRDASDNATNGICGSGQAWVLNQSGDNPAVIVGGSFIRGDGADDRMHTGEALPPLQTQCSMALRCRPLRTGVGTETLMENDSSSNRFLFRVSPAGTPFCYLSNGSFNANIYATSNLTMRQWHTLIAVWDNDTISFYIDGVAAGSSVAGFSVIPTAGNTEASLWSERGGANIGCFDISKAISFPQHALTAAEVSEIHNLLNS